MHFFVHFFLYSDPLKTAISTGNPTKKNMHFFVHFFVYRSGKKCTVFSFQKGVGFGRLVSNSPLRKNVLIRKDILTTANFTRWEGKRCGILVRTSEGHFEEWKSSVLWGTVGKNGGKNGGQNASFFRPIFRGNYEKMAQLRISCWGVIFDPLSNSPMNSSRQIARGKVVVSAPGKVEGKDEGRK